MNTYKIILIALLVTTTNLAFGQSLVLTDRDIGYTRQVIIDKESGSIVTNTKINLKAGFGDSHSTINDNGMIFTTRNIINNINASISYTDLPDVPNTVYDPQFLTNNQLLSYWESGSEYHRTLVLYDIEQDKIMNTFLFSSSPPNKTYGRAISRDGSTVAVVIEPFFTMFEYKDGDFVKEAEIGPFGVATNLFITKYGERVFYSYSGDQIAYIEKKEGNWINNLNLIKPNLNIDRYDMPLRLVDIANDGKTILTKTDVWPLERQYIALIHEEDGKWGEPELVGDYYLPPTDEDVFEADVYTSEDARVIAVRQPIVSSHVWPGEIVVVSYDIFVFIKDNKGRWDKFQVNPSDLHADRWSDVLLSPNGETLYWVPATADSTMSGIPNGDQYE